MHLKFTIKSCFFDEINYWTWGDFRKQFNQSHTNQNKQSNADVYLNNGNVVIYSINALKTQKRNSYFVEIRQMHFYQKAPNPADEM